MFQRKCKICRSRKADEIEFARFYLKWEYATIIDVFSEDIDNLNSYNLSNHFGNHADSETMKFWRSLRDSIGLYEPTTEEEQSILDSIRKGKIND